MSGIITLPYGFVWRDYQLETAHQFFITRKNRFINVWHRRAGKDKTWFNIMVAASQERIGNYCYYLPEATQARRVIWNAIDKDGKPFLDHVPKELLKSPPNQTEMMLKFVNGSTLQLCGSDRYHASRGSNPVGVVFSEYSFGHPLAWEYIRPIIRQNDGWAAFIYTPNGQNHGNTLYEANKNNPEWFVNKLTVNETRQLNGLPVTSKEDIEAERQSGMSIEDINQEYYCSFSSAIRGAYFGEVLRDAEKDGRIKDFVINTSIPVHTAWDLGQDDATSIWFYQLDKNGAINIISYYENSGKDIKFYVNLLHDFRDIHRIVFGSHYWPHDGAHKHFGHMKSPQQIAGEFKLFVTIVPRTKNKMNDIQLVRDCFHKFIFHKTNCEIGLLCLKNYHKKYNDETKSYSKIPAHDWSSHGADGIMCLCRSLELSGNFSLSGSQSKTQIGDI